jgi:DNA-binding SARP family transcriptional activator
MLVDFHEANGTYHRGLAHGSRILECDNTRENVHRQMMRLHYRSGDRNAALVQYHRCESTMRQALCCAPTAETRRLYEQIARGESVPTPGAAADAPGLEQALRRLDRVETQLQQLSQELHSVASVIRSLATDGAAEPR